MVELAVLPPVKPSPPPAPVVEAPAAAPTAGQPASQPAASVSAGTGEFGVQVAASQDPADAERLRGLIAERQASLLSDYGLTIVKAEIEDKGVYYRVRTPAFGDRSAAGSLCQSLKASGQDCFVFRAQR
jgi:cell division protein FtsN